MWICRTNAILFHHYVIDKQIAHARAQTKSVAIASSMQCGEQIGYSTADEPRRPRAVVFKIFPTYQCVWILVMRLGPHMDSFFSARIDCTKCGNRSASMQSINRLRIRCSLYAVSMCVCLPS
jgi:hypothetical protein